MPKLEYATYKQRCLTCLSKLSIDAATGNKATMNDNMKNIYEMLRRCLDKSQLEHLYLDLNVDVDVDLPRLLCIECYEKLQSFVEFRRRACYSYEMLYTLVKWKLQEIEYDDEMLEDGIKPSEQLNKTSELKNDEMNNVLFKNSLFETESVLLEPSIVTNIDQHMWDPFAKVPLTQSTEECKICVQPAIKNNKDSTTKLIFNEDVMSIKEICDSKEDGDEVLSMDCTESNTEIDLAMEYNKCLAYSNKSRQANFKCGQCNHGFNKKLTLDAHIRKSHEGFKRPFKCDRCDKSYSFIGGLNTHIKEIHEAKVRCYPCDYNGCDHIYTSFVAMKKHKRVKHSTDTASVPTRKFVCEHCGDTFKQSGNLNIHRRSKHPTGEEEKTTKLKFYCDICQKVFKSSYTLHYHKLRLHQAAGDSSKFECPVCGRKMPKKFMLVQHMHIHSKEKIPCEHCGKEFLRKFELASHIRAVHMKLKPFCCTHCSACFASSRTLRHHEYIHTGEKPYVCDICNHAFRQQTCLKNHRKTHNKSKNQTVVVDKNNAAMKMTSNDSIVLVHEAIK